MKRISKLSIIAIVALVAWSCSSDDDNSSAANVTKADVIKNYANIVYQSYKDSYDKAIELQDKVNAFTTAPTEAGFNAAKTAWLAAREPYGQTEAYRESDGPIDSNAGPNNEGQLNAWPIDEGYIDYVKIGTEPYAGNYTSIISDATITLDELTIIGKNTAAGDESVSTGWHAIEFLLWGQDNTIPAEKKKGLRTYMDYTTAANSDRRTTYLKVVTDLVVSDLKKLVDTWAVGGTYRTIFEKLDETTALIIAVKGSFFIANDELAHERMQVPVDETSGIDESGQELEHSCFADNTHRDILANAQGTVNVIFGSYGDIKGASFYDLVKQADETQAQKLKDAADAAMEKVTAIANHSDPFDLLIVSELSTDATQGPVMQGVTALKAFANEISASASTIGINLK